MKDIIQHQGEIVSIEGSHVRVMIVQQAACSGCKVRSMCSASESKEKMMDVYEDDADRKYKVGDTVLVCGTLAMGKRAVWMAFGVPLFVTVACMLVCLGVMHIDELLASAVWIALMGVYFYILYICKDRLAKKFALWIQPCCTE